MNHKELVSKLQQIKSITEECLGELSDGNKGTGDGRGSGVKKTPASKALTDHILILRSAGFLKQPKTAKEVHNKLYPTYPCNLNRVEVALLRLSQKRQLRKTSKSQGDKEVLAYVW